MRDYYRTEGRRKVKTQSERQQVRLEGKRKANSYPNLTQSEETAKPGIIPNVAQFTAEELKAVEEELEGDNSFETVIVPKRIFTPMAAMGTPRPFSHHSLEVPEGYEMIVSNQFDNGGTALFFPIDKEPTPEPIKELTRWQKIQMLLTKLWHWSKSKTAKAYKMVGAVASQVANSLKSLCSKVKTLLKPKRK